MKHFFILITILTFFSSCREIFLIRDATRIGTQVAGGKVTSYVNNYSFQLDSVVANDVLLAIEKYMQYEDWTIMSESNLSSSFEYRSSPTSQTTTGKRQNGTANFTIDTVSNEIDMLLRLRGNYKFGTKENSLEFYQKLRDYLYGIDTSKKKNKSREN